MSKAPDTEDYAYLSEPGTLRRSRVYTTEEERAAADTPEAKQVREEKLAQRETERRARSEEIFNSEWWTRKQAENWVATLDKYSLERRRVAVLYEPDGSLQDANSTRSFGTAVSDGLVKEYPKKSHGDTQYSSAQVKAAFPEVGQSAQVQKPLPEVRTNDTAMTPTKAPSRKVIGVANKLTSLYPDGPPTKTFKELGRDLKVSDTTVKRAFSQKGWSRVRVR
jgi:hypothetical protein